MQTSLKNEIKSSLINLELSQQYLQLSTIELSQENKIFFNKDVVPMVFKENNKFTTRYFDINEATQQIISKCFKIVNLPLDEFDFSNSEFFFVVHNMMNDYYKSLKTSSEYYTKELTNKSTGNKKLFLALLIASAVVIFLAIIIIIPLYERLTITETEVKI